MSAVTITVTEQHIEHGSAKDCSGCPIALAINDAFPDISYVEVMNPDLGYALVTDHDGGCVDLDLPSEARDFIAAFDASAPVSPFTFTAEVTR